MPCVALLALRCSLFMHCVALRIRFSLCWCACLALLSVHSLLCLAISVLSRVACIHYEYSQSPKERVDISVFLFFVLAFSFIIIFAIHFEMSFLIAFFTSNVGTGTGHVTNIVLVSLTQNTHFFHHFC